MTAPKKSSSASQRQHLLLIVLTLCGATLVLYFVQTRSIKPRLNQQKRINQEETQRLDYMRTQLAARQAIDLPAMRTEVEKARASLRTAQVSGGNGEGAPFINSRALGDVAAFYGTISRQAIASRLRIHKHASVSASTDPRLTDLLVRDLEVQGRFPDILNFVEALKDLPHRIVVLSLDLGQELGQPGYLRVVLRYSV